MDSRRSKIISLTLPEELLTQIDELAKRDYATRSDIIRQAALNYVRESGISEVEIKKTPAPKKPKPQRDMKKLAKKYPQVMPGDVQLLEFLDDYANNKL